jgi:thymidylate kinase
MTATQYAIEKSWQQTCRQVPLFDEDIIIYLHCPVEIAPQRIKERGRTHESSCTVERLTKLEERYQTNVLEPHKRVFFVDTSRPLGI